MNLQGCLLDPTIEDIAIRPGHYFFYQKGHWSAPFEIQNDAALAQKIFRLAEESSQLNLGMTQPTGDGFLQLSPEISFRVHVVVHPMSQFAFELTLRRIHPLPRYRLDDFCRDPVHTQILTQTTLSGGSLLIAGATGSGKTSFLSALLQLLPSNTRTLILEDTPEIPLPNKISCKLSSRHNRYKHRLGAEWSLESLLIESLRMRPDRIVLGECRSTEARAVKLATKTGHSGVITTIHAGNCHQAMERFETLSHDEKNPVSDSEDSIWQTVVFLETQANGQKQVKELLCPKQATPLKFALSV